MTTLDPYHSSLNASGRSELVRPLEKVSMAADSKENQGFDLWRETCRPVADTVSRAPLPSYKTAFEFYNVNDILFNRTQYSATNFKRDQRLVRRGEGDFIAIHMLLRGSEKCQMDGRAFSKDPERIIIQDWAHAFESMTEDCEQICVVIPRERLSMSDRFYEKHPVIDISRSSPQGLILSSALLSTWAALPLATQSDAPSIAASFLGTLEGLCGPTREMESESIPSRATLVAMQDLLIKNLHDPAIGLDTLMTAFKCSRTTVFRLFRDCGGVRGFLNEQRLNEAYRVISESEQLPTTISKIALAIGFSDVGYFHRVFKRRFGMTTSEVRDSSRDRKAALAQDSNTSLHCRTELKKLHDWLTQPPMHTR